ncbi:MAG: hypothetical protein AB1714_28020 [Acidobacteriota bacterium]
MSGEINRGRCRARLQTVVAGALVCALLTGVTARAESLTGSWRAAQLSIEMTLNPDGTYLFGQWSGRYAVQGSLITFQDAASGMLTSYLVNLGGDQMIFTDANGAMIYWQRLRLPERQQAGGGVLCTAGGLTLTTTAVETGIHLLQFIINAQLNEQERNALTQQAVSDFQQNPAGFLGEMQKLGQSIQVLRQVTDPLQVGLLRQALVVEFYKADRAMPATQRPIFLRVLFDHVHVLASDDTNNLVFTREDAEALLAYLSFIQQASSGQLIQWTEASARSAIESIAARFPKMSLQEKQFCCSMSILWNYFRHAWETAALAQRQQMVQQMFARTAQAPPAQNYSGVAPPAALAYRSSGEMSDSQYNTVMNALKEDYVSTMNAWGNIGESPYYYEIVDY